MSATCPDESSPNSEEFSKGSTGTVSETLVGDSVARTSEEGASSSQDDSASEDEGSASDSLANVFAWGKEQLSKGPKGGSDELSAQHETISLANEDGGKLSVGIKLNALPASEVFLTAPALRAAKSQDKGKARDTLKNVLKDTDTPRMGDKWGKTPDVHLSKKKRRELYPNDSGKGWFNMPAPEVTPELKRELQAMRLRNILDPKRFYKGSADDKKIPEFFQLGHVVSSSQSARTAPEAKQRKRTFVDELIEDEKMRAYTKRKFTEEVMPRGMSGRSRSRKGMKSKRK